jgi:hypothetical protein
MDGDCGSKTVLLCAELPSSVRRVQNQDRLVSDDQRAELQGEPLKLAISPPSHSLVSVCGCGWGR